MHKPLPETFTKYGDTFQQIERIGDAAIYSRTSPNGRKGYEVILISRHDGYEVQGVVIPPAEVYPSSSAWGTYGWTTNDRIRADELFSAAIKKDKARQREQQPHPWAGKEELL